MFDPVSLGIGAIGAASSAFQMHQQKDMFKQQQYNANMQAVNAANFNAEQSALGRAFSADEAAKQRGWSSNEAEVARQWTEKLSNSAYQRTMADMKKAGLNPILAYQKGGASTPTGSAPGGASASGSSASVGMPNNPSAPILPNLAQNAVSTAMEWARTEPQIRIANQEEVNRKEEELRIAADSKLKTAQASEVIARRDLYNQQERTEKERTDMMKRGAAIGDVDSKYYQEDNTGVRQWGRNVGNFLRDINPFISNAKSLQQMINPW